ncbi:MAG TPA: hypothetical protein VME18_02475 [Acidobacteriaceae bacterium]|nr:hypothetical protein [Acidobacteriaceae bacterium]
MATLLKMRRGALDQSGTAKRFHPCGKCENGLVRVRADGSQWNSLTSPAGTQLVPCACRIAGQQKAAAVIEINCERISADSQRPATVTRYEAATPAGDFTIQRLRAACQAD